MIQRLVSILVFSLVLAAPASACPKHSGLIDYNCDGEVNIVVLGDSFVSGIGDTRNDNKGGYVLRAQNRLPNVSFQNWGVPGQRTFELLSMLRDAIAKGKKPELLQDILKADVVILDLGRNDRWLFGEPLASYRNLKRATTLIMSAVRRQTGLNPLVVKAVLMLPNRGSQGPWVAELNKLILNSNSQSYPADLRFDLVSKRLLASDQLHPTPQGYDEIASVFRSYLKRSLNKRMKKLRPDTDKDLIADIYETDTFGTSPDNPDTDGDLKSDSQELFETLTDPLVAD